MSFPWLSWGYTGLGLSAFLGATILPLSSEVTFTAALLAGLDPGLSLLVASLGNGAAVMLNYGLGRFGRDRLSPKTIGKLAPADRLVARWGRPALLLSWLPVIGDPLTIVAGALRVPVLPFALICLPLRVARYVALMLAVDGWMR